MEGPSGTVSADSPSAPSHLYDQYHQHPPTSLAAAGYQLLVEVAWEPCLPHVGSVSLVSHYATSMTHCLGSEAPHVEFTDTVWFRSQKEGQILINTYINLEAQT